MVDAWTEIQAILGIKRSAAAMFAERVFNELELTLYIDDEKLGLWFPCQSSAQERLLRDLTCSECASGENEDPGGWGGWRLSPSDYEKLIEQTRCVAERGSCHRKIGELVVGIEEAAQPGRAPLTTSEDLADIDRLKTEIRRLSGRLSGSRVEVSRLGKAIARNARLAAARQQALASQLDGAIRQAGRSTADSPSTPSILSLRQDLVDAIEQYVPVHLCCVLLLSLKMKAHQSLQSGY
jgi:hypothetical protein